MTSDALGRLRSSAERQAAIYKRYRAGITKTHQDPFLGFEAKRQTLQKLIDSTKAELATLQAQCEADRAELQKRADARSVKATPEAVAKVQRLLDNGYDWSSLAQQLAAEGDRTGLAALAAELPYYAKKNKIDSRQIPEMQQTLQTVESRLWDDKERQWHQEVREASIGLPLVTDNHKKINMFVERGLLSGADRESLQLLYRWNGLPNDDSQPKGMMVLENV